MIAYLLGRLIVYVLEWFVFEQSFQHSMIYLQKGGRFILLFNICLLFLYSKIEYVASYDFFCFVVIMEISIFENVILFHYELCIFIAGFKQNGSVL